MARGYDAARAQAIGAKIREAREARGYTGEKVAKAIGISTQHLYRIEKGRRMATVTLLSKLAACLGVDMSFFLPDGESNPNGIPSKPQNPRRRNELRLWLTVIEDAEAQHMRPEDLKNAIALFQAVKRLMAHK